MKLSPYVFQLQATLRTLRLWKRYDSSGDVGDLVGELAEPLVQRRHVGVEAHEHHPAPRVDLDRSEVHAPRARRSRSRGR